MGYTKYQYQVVKLDKRAYFPRADDPMKMVLKEWEKALLVSKMWHNEGMRKAYFPRNDEVAQQVRPTIVMQSINGAKMRGARFSTAQEWEGVPYGDNESDLKTLEKEHERRYKQATLDNTSNRIKMMLGMLGDVQVQDSEDVSYSQLTRLKYNNDNFKLFKVKDCTLILFEPEGVS